MGTNNGLIFPLVVTSLGNGHHALRTLQPINPSHAMEFRKVGRGGVGNFLNPQDPEKVSRERIVVIQSSHTNGYTALTILQDLEAQSNAAKVGVKDLVNQGREISTSGRGGAGNITTRAVLTAGSNASIDVTPSLQESKPPEPRYYGRGGAGNYRIPEPENRRGKVREATDARERAQRKVVEDVEMGLKEPEKAHLGRECDTHNHSR